MTEQELKVFGEELMEFGVDHLRNRQVLVPMFKVIHADERVSVVCEPVQHVAYRAVRELVAGGNVEAVVMVASVRFRLATEEEFKADPDMGKKGVGTDGADAVMVLAETPMLQILGRQQYRTEYGQMTLVGEPTWDRGVLNGQFWPSAPAGRPN